MGNRVSAYQQAKLKARERSEEIDEQIEKERSGLRGFKKCKLLVLGTDKSSKSAALKQMKIDFGDGYTREELLNYRGTVYRNLLGSAKGVLMAMQKFGIDCVETSNQANMERILGYEIVSSDPFSTEIAQLIHQLWNDPIISTLLDHGEEFYPMDNTNYFLTEALRIGKSGYVPTVTDVLRVREENTAITEAQFKVELLTVHVIDVGVQRSEQKKWIHCFEDVTGILFCVALSEYDQIELDGSSQNRMETSLLLFDSVINSRWFKQTSIALIFTKIGNFKAKLRKVPLEQFFPEYTGGMDTNKAAKHILWRFMQRNRACLAVYPHITHTIDTVCLRLVSSMLKETVLQNALNDLGILQ